MFVQWLSKMLFPRDVHYLRSNNTKFVLTFEYTLEEHRSKQVSIIGMEDKREITVLLACSLSTQLLYTGKKTNCHPKSSFSGWTKQEEYYSNFYACFLHRRVLAFGLDCTWQVEAFAHEWVYWVVSIWALISRRKRVCWSAISTKTDSCFLVCAHI